MVDPLIVHRRISARKIAYEYCAGQPSFDDWLSCMEKTESKIIESVSGKDELEAYMELEAIYTQCLMKRLRDKTASARIFKECIDEKLGW